MAERVFLHIGLPKSGTSYLQSVLAANKQRLADEAGLLFPGESWADQVRAVRVVRQMRIPRRRRREHRGAWQSLVDESRRWPGDVIVSMEWLCAAEDDHIERIVSSFDPAEVHVVVTARDLGRTLPAAWQEAVKNQRSRDWGEFLARVTADDARSLRGGRKFWAQHDLAAVLASWSRVVPVARVHVVTVPHEGPRDLIWHRLCDVVQVDGDRYETSNLRDNASLGLETVEVLRRVGPPARQLGVPRQRWAEAVRRGVVGPSPSAPAPSRLAVPPALHPWVQERALEIVQAVEGSGVQVQGDVADLLPRLTTDTGRQPEDLSAEQLLDVATHSLARALSELTRTRRQAERRQRRTEARLRRLRRENRELRSQVARLERRTLRGGVRRLRDRVRAVTG